MVVQTAFVTVEEHAGHKGSFSRRRKLEERREKNIASVADFSGGEDRCSFGLRVTAEVQRRRDEYYSFASLHIAVSSSAIRALHRHVAQEGYSRPGTAGCCKKSTGTTRARFGPQHHKDPASH